MLSGMASEPTTVDAYHQRSKHSLRRYAPGPHGLDWANQPDPFRRFAACPRTPLPLIEALPTRYDDLYRPGAIPPAPIEPASIAALLQFSLGLAAWKQFGDSRWALRCNPSSGNLHPTEGYLILPAGAVAEPAGVYHYLSRDHLLEQRCRIEADRTGLPKNGFLFGLGTIFWREAWKYGERAFRYCQLDAGHAIAAIRYAAAVLGWRVRLLDGWSDDDIAALLGLDRDEDFGNAEQEHPDVMLLVTAGTDMTPEWQAGPPEILLAAVENGEWRGKANRLSPTHGHDWPIIDRIAAATAKPGTTHAPFSPPTLPPLAARSRPLSASRLIRQRRSAQAFDGQSTMRAEDLFHLLDLTLPRAQTAPLDALPRPPRIHLLLFVHRVEGLDPGIYLFSRDTAAPSELKRAMRPDFLWDDVPDAPDHLNLKRLLPGDAREAAKLLSCHQDIASDSAIALAMLAEFETPLSAAPWVYRALFQEAGAIGQALYLEAEAIALRGTGIGCYFDDDVHELLGLSGSRFQDLYHFTIGGPLDDARLQTLPPYAHLEREAVIYYWDEE